MFITDLRKDAVKTKYAGLKFIVTDMDAPVDKDINNKKWKEQRIKVKDSQNKEMGITLNNFCISLEQKNKELLFKNCENQKYESKTHPGVIVTYLKCWDGWELYTGQELNESKVENKIVETKTEVKKDVVEKSNLAEVNWFIKNRLDHRCMIASYICEHIISPLITKNDFNDIKDVFETSFDIVFNKVYEIKTEPAEKPVEVVETKKDDTSDIPF